MKTCRMHGPTLSPESGVFTELFVFKKKEEISEILKWLDCCNKSSWETPGKFLNEDQTETKTQMCSSFSNDSLWKIWQDQATVGCSLLWSSLQHWNSCFSQLAYGKSWGREAKLLCVSPLWKHWLLQGYYSLQNMYSQFPHIKIRKTKEI